jgi:hypothetical protein
MENLTMIYQVSLHDTQRTSYSKSPRPSTCNCKWDISYRDCAGHKTSISTFKKMNHMQNNLWLQGTYIFKTKHKNEILKIFYIRKTQHFQLTSGKRKGKLRNVFF